MREIIHKWFWAWDFEKEEKWLNEMAVKGLGLISVGFCRYEFGDCMPGEYRICLQLLDKMPRHPESKKYMEFLETTGAEYIGSYGRWVYFRKKAAAGDFELFSDNDSRIKYISGVMGFVALIILLNLMVGAYNVIAAKWFSSLPNCLGIINVMVCIWGIWGIARLMKQWNKIKREGRLFE